MDLAAGTTQFTILAFAGLLIAAAASDWRNLTVPNSYSLALAGLFPSYVLASGGGVDWMSSLIYAGVAFAAGFLLFTLRICGGGDVKLFAVVALWAGPAFFVPMLFYTTVSGGLLAVGMWLHHKLTHTAPVASLAFSSGDAGYTKQPMPYAVAIAVGGLYVALQLLLGV
ncbi:MAG: prepilin peptidase [Kiloniellaceae bacterium]